MLDLGLGALAHANRHAAYAAYENDRWPDLSVLQAAHAAELLIKARIAQEHPLLVFEYLPRPTAAAVPQLDLDQLFRDGRTYQWSELPDRLWASTGIVLPERKQFEQFGRLRNGIQHFAPAPEQNAGEMALKFVFGVIDPLINECWDLYAIDFDEDYEPYLYFVRALVSREITFLVSKDAAACFRDWDADWDCVSESYRDLMHERVRVASA